MERCREASLFHQPPSFPALSHFLDLLDDPAARRVLFCAAALLLTVPFVQAGSQIWPLQLSNIQWRFGAANALSSILLLPFLGLVLVLLVARGTESRAWSRAVGAGSALFALGLLGSLIVFALDALQLRAIVSTQMSGAFNSTAVRVGIVTSLFFLAFSYLTVLGFTKMPGLSAASRRSSKASKDQSEDRGLIVGVREG